MPVFLAFILIPVVEIWLFVKVGGVIGAWQTAGLVVAIALAGAILVRIQGFAVLDRARATLAAGEFPTAALFDGLFVLIAGFLLITPGFLTDIAGGLLFIPPLRRWLGAVIWDWISHRPDMVILRSERAEVVEGTYHEIDPDAGPSGGVIAPQRGGKPAPSDPSDPR